MPLVVDLDNLGYYLAAGATAPADYSTGTVQRTAGAVTGSGTTWTAAMVGRTIKIGSGAATTSNTYLISAFTDSTHLTVVSCVDGTSAPGGSDAGGTAYNISANITIDTTSKLIYVTVGNLVDTAGVTLKAVYSKLKAIWKSDTTAIKFLFPATPITDEQMEFVDWKFGDTGSRELIRTGGWAEKTGTTTNREYAGVITLGSLGGTDQVYYRQVSTDGAPTDIVLTGPVNQAIQTYGDATNGNFDYRSYLKLFVREQAKTYADSSLTDIGVTTMTYQAYRFPLSNGTDLKVTEPDVTVDAYGVTITWYAAAQSRNIGGTNRFFHVIIDGNNRTAEEIYMAVQSALRKATDIDAGAGTKTGQVTNSLLQFVGDTLKTKLDSTGGVFIDNYQIADVNRLVFTDDSGIERTFPYVASLTLNFGSNLVADAAAIYRVFFTTNPAGNFGTTNAVIVNDATPAPMSGNISGSPFVQLSFDYDANSQGGRTPGTDANITVVAIGLSTAQYVVATGTITRSTSNSVSLVSSLERNYINP
jgi:hypothetical protein